MKPIKILINIAADFTRTPGSRYKKHGPFSGEEFRETILSPKFEEAVQQDTYLYVNLDGAIGYAIAFLEEAFGGLARIYGRQRVKNKLVFISHEEPHLPNEILKLIENSGG